MRRLAALTGVVVTLLLAPAAAGYPTMVLGATENRPFSLSLLESRAQFELATALGLETIRIDLPVPPDADAPSVERLERLQTTARAAALTGVRLMVAVYPGENRRVPLDDEARARFAAHVTALVGTAPAATDWIVGNEPNLNAFWLPQYDAAGVSASPAAYTALLATAYDAIKAADPSARVIGGAVSPRGTDKPNGLRPTHSPGNFILGMGAAYRAGGRTLPLMDAFAFHPYGDRSRQPPGFAHPRSTSIGIADYGKLVSFLGQAFDGTAQAGTTVPIVYDEYGVQTAIPADKAGLYTNADAPAAADAVDDETQARHYREALALAACQPTVVGFLFFHTVDEPDLRRWQSGLYYDDLTPKPSFFPVQEAVDLARRGMLVDCPGLAVPVEVERLVFPRGRRFNPRNRIWKVRLACRQDCVALVRLEREDGVQTLARRAILVGGEVTTVRLPTRLVAPGRYRFTVTLVGRKNPADPLIQTGPVFQAG